MIGKGLKEDKILIKIEKMEINRIIYQFSLIFISLTEDYFSFSYRISIFLLLLIFGFLLKKKPEVHYDSSVTIINFIFIFINLSRPTFLQQFLQRCLDCSIYFTEVNKDFIGFMAKYLGYTTKN